MTVPWRNRGSSLLECAASIAVAGLMLASSTRSARAAAMLVQEARLQADAIDVARNLLEHELGAPCGAPFDCPDGYRCEVTRSAATASADRVTARATRDDGRAGGRFHTLAPLPSCGG